MYTKLTIPERLKDLRTERHLTLQELSEQTHISKSSLGNYESEDMKDISPFSIATLAEFYGVSTDYLMGLTESKNHSDTELAALHLNDDMINLLSSGKINNRLLCEIATHRDFERLMTDIEIVVDRIANMRTESMNLIMEATRQQIMQKHNPGENDLHVRTLEVAQVADDDFFNYIIHKDMDGIVADIRDAHGKDKTTADEPPTLDDIKKEFEEAMNYDSQMEAMMREFCVRMAIPYDKLSQEEMNTFAGILKKSKHLSNPQSMRGRATAAGLYQTHGKGKRKRKK
jgi:transcriptional regulator with XRE-family HTH domain